MKKLLVFLLFLVSICCQSQIAGKFNLGFENKSKMDSLPDGWIKWGYYPLAADDMAHSGKSSGKISSSEDGSFGSIAYKIPANYKGDSIMLEGYMKIKEVKNGFAGLLLRVDGNGNVLGFDNMQNQNIQGTKDWEKYSITLDFPRDAENIFVAGILSGKGEAWFDDFTLTIDGNNVQTLPEIKKEPSKASLDKEFDKGSNIQISSLSLETNNNLELMGRIWGFLKYHHPQIAKGNYNWDYELFRILPKYMEAQNSDQREDLLIHWINSLGSIEKCTSCQSTVENAKIKPDLKWLDNLGLGLKNKLLFVYENRSQESNYYVGLAPGIGNPEFKNENQYIMMTYPDDGFRLLSLYRYWNMINYFFPYKHLMDKDWNNTLGEYIPAFINARNELEYEMATIQIIGEIQDTHANLWGGADKIEAWKGTNYPSIHVRFMENQLVVTDYYKPEMSSIVGLKVGDVITKIDDVPISTIMEEKSKYYPASNLPTMLRDLSGDILRSNAPDIEINYLSEKGVEQKMTLKLYPKNEAAVYHWYKTSNEKSYKKLSNQSGYITLQTIQAEDIPNIMVDFKDTKGIIIDIRNYPANFVPFSLGSFFVSHSTPFVKFTSGNISNPGTFTYSENLEIPSQDNTYKGKLIILVNELTQSQAEYTSMAFRAGPNTTIIGSTTAGADGNVSTILLPGGLRTMISGIGVYYPDGTETQRIGIIPDIVCKPTIAGIRAGKDELMEKAIEVILGD
ncbi:MAG: S41 family peptidase [Saprospiraceae bacterium]